MPKSYSRQAYTCYGFVAQQESRLAILGFNGQQRGRLTDCYYLGNGYRAYNPKLMRFNSTDNLSPFLHGGINAYAYCGGDPINNIDPSGHWFWSRSEPKYALSMIKKTDTHKLTQQYSGWYHHPAADGWDAEMAIKLPKRVEKKIYYATQLQLAKNGVSNAPIQHIQSRLDSVSAKIAKTRTRLEKLKRELPLHALTVMNSMLAPPPPPPPYPVIDNHSVVPNDIDATIANYQIRLQLTQHVAPPVYRKTSDPNY
ncbi:RHS repeat-associated core domain-containing protein [Pseudomonas asiatica]|uniref:RHS repeat-associated core domain-containing protein n=1 Tax=Pseudomonas asiatica TaxID=2219225 RepID=UPI00383AEE2C